MQVKSEKEKEKEAKDAKEAAEREKKRAEEEFRRLKEEEDRWDEALIYNACLHGRQAMTLIFVKALLEQSPTIVGREGGWNGGRVSEEGEGQGEQPGRTTERAVQEA